MASRIPDGFHRISVTGLHFQGKKVLLIKESSGIWKIPGGGLLHGETIEHCLRREVREEMGVGIRAISKLPLVVLPMRHRGVPRLLLVYKITLSSLRLKQSDECTDFSFFSTKELRKLRVYPSIRKVAKLL